MILIFFNKKKISCFICLDNFIEYDKIPFMINCGHSFCNMCLTHLEECALVNQIIKCPLCKMDIKDNFTPLKNFALLEVLRTTKCKTKEILEKCISSLNDEISEKSNICMSLQNKYLSLQADYLELTSECNDIYKEEYEKALMKAKEKFNCIENEWHNEMRILKCVKKHKRNFMDDYDNMVQVLKLLHSKL